MKKISFLFRIMIMSFCPLLFISCELFDNNSKPQLPPITSEGKGTFVCLVNGEVWLAKGRLGNTGIFAHTSGSYFLSIGGDNNNNNTGIRLLIIDSTDIKINKPYILIGEKKQSAEYNFRKDGGGICFTDYSHVISGKIILTKKDNKAISGTFEFTTYRPDCGDTIKVTDGRFDIGEIDY